MFFLLFITLQGVYTYSYHGLCRSVPLPLLYKAVTPVYAAGVTSPSPFVRCLETARGFSSTGLFTYPVYTCWNQFLKFKDSRFLAYPTTNSLPGYNIQALTGPVAYGQSSSWAGSYGNPSLLSGVSASAQASASATAGGLTVSSGSSSSANASSSITTDSFGQKPDFTSTTGSSSVSTSSGGSGGYYGYTGSGGGNTLNTGSTSTNPTFTGYYSNHFLNGPSSTGSAGSGVYYTGYNVPTSTNTGASTTSLLSHPPGYYVSYYKPSGVTTTATSGQDGHYIIYYYQPINVAGSGSGTSATGTHYTGTGNYYNVYHKPSGTTYETNPLGGTNNSSSISTDTEGTSGSYSSLNGSQSNVHLTAGQHLSYGSNNQSQIETNITSALTTEATKPWWLGSGVFAASLASSSTLGFPTSTLIPANETGLSTGSALGSISSGTSASGIVMVTLTGSTSGTSSSSDTTSNVSAGNTETGTDSVGVGSGSTLSSSTSGFNSNAVSNPATSQVEITSGSISSAGSSSLGTSNNIYGAGTNSNLESSSGGTVTATPTDFVSSTSYVTMPLIETVHVPSHENTIVVISNASSLAQTSFTASSGMILGPVEIGSSNAGGNFSTGSSPTTVSYLITSSGTGATLPSSAGLPTFTNYVPETTTPIVVTSTMVNNVPWWVSSGIPGVSSIFGSVTASESGSSVSSSHITSELGTNSGSAIIGPSQTNTTAHTPEGAIPQTGSPMNTGGPWWLSGGLFGGSGVGSSVTSGAITGSEQSSSVSNEYGNTGGGSALGLVQNGTDTSIVSSNGSGGSSIPWWLSGLLSSSGGGPPIKNSTGTSIGLSVATLGSAVSSVPGNNTFLPLDSNSQQNVHTSNGESIVETLSGMGSSIFNSGTGGSAPTLGASSGSSIPPWLSSLVGQTQTTGTGIGASSVSTSASAVGAGLSSLPGSSNLPSQFYGGQSGIPSVLGSSASSSATAAAASSSSILNPTNIGELPNKPDHPWWQSGGLTGLGSSPYLKSSRLALDNIKNDTLSKTESNLGSLTKSIAIANSSLLVNGSEKVL